MPTLEAQLGRVEDDRHWEEHTTGGGKEKECEGMRKREEKQRTERTTERDSRIATEAGEKRPEARNGKGQEEKGNAQRPGRRRRRRSDDDFPCLLWA